DLAAEVALGDGAAARTLPAAARRSGRPTLAALAAAGQARRGPVDGFADLLDHPVGEVVDRLMLGVCQVVVALRVGVDRVEVRGVVGTEVRTAGLVVHGVA